MCNADEKHNKKVTENGKTISDWTYVVWFQVEIYWIVQNPGSEIMKI